MSSNLNPTSLQQPIAENVAEAVAEHLVYPEDLGGDCDCCGYGCHECGVD